MRMTFGRGFTGLTGLLALSAGFSLLIGCKAAAPEDVSESSTSELGARAADPTGVGPLTTTSAEYRFAASTDADILADRKTEIWARVYRPTVMANNEKHPLLVFLHGNHGTCGRGSNPRIDDNTQYTSQGTCPTGYVPTPNHLGYGYVAERLASWGYVVVSVNANRGITAGSGAADDFGLNLARGRLILKHLQLLSKWNNEVGETPSSLGVDLVGKLDFSNVGMMGHSRGGEGVRAAYVQYKDANSPWPARITDALNVKAIFEIGPVDGQTSRVLDAHGTAWNVILPMCDGDVFNLQGMRPFDRMLSSATAEANPTPKGMFAVWGANHNFFNTEWQQSDSSGCRGAGHTPLWETTSGTTIVGSTKQQTAGLHALMGFFRAHVGTNANTELNNAYDPLFQVPQSLEDVTRVTRAYADASNAANVKVLEDFTKPAGTALSGQPTVAHNVTVTHGGVSEHDPILKAASIKWTSATDTYFEVPFVAPGASVDASAMKTLDFRVSRQNTNPPSTGALSFSIRLVNKDGTLSQAVKLSSYLDVSTWGGHAVLDTARIPLSDFTNAQLANIKGVRFQFDDTATGAIFLTSVRLSRSALVNTSAPIDPGTNNNLNDTNGTQQDTVAILTGNQVNGMQLGPSNEVEVELQSGYQFPVTDDLPRLRIGSHDVLVSGFREHGDTHNIVFKISKDELANLPSTAPMKVRYGADHATYEWDFGTFRKSNITTR